ncbi:MAG: hypothetical protein H6709_16110 [Kofleriaceae bacterium]|nr:hypothetical protein [Kofleriaceae bacterium]MCB9573604.1 hypothetical protein [Kofleriaceae bacterium]
MRFGELASLFLSTLVPLAAAGTTVGCGGDDGATVDAAGADARRVDAATAPDATAPGQVTVIVRGECCDATTGQPIADADVFAIQPDGTMGDRTTTAADGTATLDDVAPGAIVTAIVARTDGHLRISYLGVQPGDHLELGDAPRPPQADGAVTVDWPLATGANSYRMYVPCTSAGGDATTTSATAQIGAWCLRDPFAVLVVALDASNVPIQSAVVHGISPIAGGGTATGSVTAWQAPGTLSSTVATVPAEITASSRYAATLLGTSTGHPVYVNGFDPVTSPWPGADTEGTLTSSYFGRDGDFGALYSSQVLAPATTTWSTRAPTLPWLAGLLANAAAQQARWVTVGDGSYDATILGLSWRDYVSPPGAWVYDDWYLVMPPGTTEFDWSTLPAGLDELVPPEALAVDAWIDLVDLPGVDDYDAVRALPARIALCPACTASLVELGAGAVVDESYDEGGGFLLRPATRRPPAHRAARAHR